MIDLNVLHDLSVAPSEPEAFNRWLTMDSAIAFLHENTCHDELVIFASLRGVFLHGLVVPAALVTPPDIDDLMEWNCRPDSRWAISVMGPTPKTVAIASPLSATGSQTLDQGEQLVFTRHFEGYSERRRYVELLQKFLQAFDLHFMEERNAYCRLDKRGDIEEIVRVRDVAGTGDDSGTQLVLCNRDVLDEYLTLTDGVLVRTFDVTRWYRDQFGGWSQGHEIQFKNDGDLFFRLHVEAGYASYLRGIQLIRSGLTREAIIKRQDLASDERLYASFIAQDWKNNVVGKISCAPGATANYFTKSDLPFEVSPAFFKPEVLLRYKADTDKYRLVERSISCRGAWYLRSYDVNDAGQVSAYLIDLRRLPYEEQLYWKLYDERPKAPISKRAFTTDFAGEWDLEYDPLPSLKAFLDELRRGPVVWWTLRSEKLPDQLQYPVTASPDEWTNALLLLDQLIVEGLATKLLLQEAIRLGRTPQMTDGSLKLVSECLVGLGVAASDAHDIVAPLKETHDLRSKLKGHASGTEGAALKQQILKAHGSYAKHFHALCQRCDESLRVLGDAFKNMT
jgi:hypothetical protein